jgi:hypothetical protein
VSGGGPAASDELILLGSAIDSWEVPLVDLAPRARTPAEAAGICSCRRIRTTPRLPMASLLLRRPTTTHADDLRLDSPNPKMA